MIVGHIGLRKGSKGLPGKNWKEICGKPLYMWSLEQLIESAVIDAIVVSTDDDKIYRDAVLKNRVLDTGLRCEQLAGDEVSKWAVWQNSLEKAEERVGSITAMVDLDCTNPLRSLEDIEEAVDLFDREEADLVMSCCEARKNPYFNLVEYDEEGYLRVSKTIEGASVVARQAAPTVLEHIASTYVVSPNYLRRNDFLFGGKVIPYLMDPSKSFDIDSSLDFEIVEFLLRKKTNEYS